MAAEREEGMEAGLKQGLANGIEQMALNLLTNIKDIPQAAALLKLPVEEMQRIAQKNGLSFICATIQVCYKKNLGYQVHHFGLDIPNRIK